jgi:hypothetical protein
MADGMPRRNRIGAPLSTGSGWSFYAAKTVQALLAAKTFPPASITTAAAVKAFIIAAK